MFFFILKKMDFLVDEMQEFYKEMTEGGNDTASAQFKNRVG